MRCSYLETEGNTKEKLRKTKKEKAEAGKGKKDWLMGFSELSGIHSHMCEK